MTGLANLWPTPREVELRVGEISLAEPVRLALGTDVADWEDALLARLAWLAPRTGAAVTGARIRVKRDLGLGEEEYRLVVDDLGIHVTAATVLGAGQAAVTLRQLVGPDAFRAVALHRQDWVVPAVRISDGPAHEWRGFMLDVARYFTPKDELLRIVERLAMHRINRLHLHLTEDQGWRVASDAYPALAEVASWRTQTAIGMMPLDGSVPELDGTPHGGFYTLDDLREISAYARLHGITVVPEIDLPAHASALMAAIPETVTPGCPVPEVAAVFLPSGRVVSPLPESRHVLDTLIRELADAVGSPYVHIGGDEAGLADWQSSEAVAAYMAERDLADVTELRRDLTQHLVATVEADGRRAIVWEEAFLAGGLPRSVIVMPWMNEATGAAAATAGHDVVLTPMQHCYLDYSEDGPDGPLSIGSGMTIERVGAYVPAATPGPGRLLGTHAAVWSEFTPDAATRAYRMFPRVAVHAANAWTGQATPWPDARPRLEEHLRRLDAAGVAYRPLDGPTPWQRGGTGRRRMTSPLTVDIVSRMMQAMAAGDGSLPDLDTADLSQLMGDVLESTD